MSDFLVRVELSGDNDPGFQGKIKMYAGDNLIQDDILEEILLKGTNLKFYIPAKETAFEGNFNDLFSELTGGFIFPDGTMHPIDLAKKGPENQSIEKFSSTKGKKIDAQDLRSDLLFLYTTLNEQHPQLHAFSSKDSLDLLFMQINDALEEPMTFEEFYSRACGLTNAVRCSHTGLKLPASYQNLVEANGRFFPLRLYFKNGRAFYLSGISEEDFPVAPGNEIISIDDQPVSEIIKEVFAYIPAEGCNTTTKYNEINKSFNSLYYYVNESNAYDVVIKTGDSTERIKVSSCSYSEIDPNRDSPGNKGEFDFKYVDNETAGVLTLSSFAIPDMDRYFSQLDSVFRDLNSRNIQNLVIDLRDNSGGHPIFAAQLLSYLTDKEFVYFKRNEEIKDFEPLYNAMQPNALHYSGNLYALVNGGCLSTTGHLISLLKSYTDAIFIGEEPGSTFRCNDFSMQVALPNSGISLNVPRTTFETSVTGFALCEPFPIDHRIILDASDLIDTTDAYMEKVRALCKK